VVDNTSFAGEKECITYAKAGGALTVIAYPDAKGVCESFGGTYANETGIVSGGSGKPAQWSCTYQSVDDAFGALVNRCVLDAAHTGTFAVAYVMVSGDPFGLRKDVCAFQPTL